MSFHSSLGITTRAALTVGSAARLTVSALHRVLKPVAIVLETCAASAALAATPGSAVQLTTDGGGSAQFCTRTGHIMVSLGCTRADPAKYSLCSFGEVLLTGTQTYHFGVGNHLVAKGCYTEVLAHSSLWGSAIAIGTVYHD